MSADQGIENLLLISLGLVLTSAIGLWGLAQLLSLLTSVSLQSFAKQGAWQATVQQYAVFAKRLADQFFGSGPLKISLEHIILFAILIVLVGLWRASSPPKSKAAAGKAAAAPKRPAATAAPASDE